MQENEQLRGAIDFLMWSYFNLTLDDGDNLDRILGICLHKAYLDATQMGAYNALIPKEEKELKDISDKARGSGGKKLRDQISTLLKGDVEEFETWHKETCREVKKAYEEVNKSNDTELFSYGNAQKWVNMTLKYIYLLHELYQAFSPGCLFCREYESAIGEKYAKAFHAPADSFIIKALGKVPGLKKDDAWSKWGEDEYNKYQKELLNRTEQSGKNQLKWEGPSWIEVAKREKEKDLKKLESRYQSEN